MARSGPAGPTSHRPSAATDDSPEETSDPASAPIQTHFAKNLTINGAGSVDLELMGVDGRVMVSNSTDVLLFSADYGDDVSLINNSSDVLVAAVNIAGTLNCEANTPPPPVGFDVNAAGYRGQCAASP